MVVVRICMVLLTFTFLNKGVAQERVVDISGRITDISNTGIKGVLVGTKHRRQFTQSNVNGLFNLLAQMGDTLVFSQIGYINRKIIIPDTLSKPFYSLDMTMIPDTIVIDPVIIFPWRTYDDFKAAFLAHIPEENREMKNALHNIALINSQLYSYELHDSKRSYHDLTQQQITNSINKGMVQSFNIINPLSWIKFFQAISEGTFTNSRDIPPLPESNK